LSPGAAQASPPEKLSIVIGSVESRRSLARCLDALETSCSGLDAEILVVNAGRDPEVERCVAGHPGVRLIERPADSLTPMLWSEGITSTNGDVFALLTGHTVVSPGWARALLDGLRHGASGAGGPLRLADDASRTDAAIFFLRYSAFLEGRPDSPVNEIAGDNAAYVRAAVPSGSWTREGGFWETDVNRAILKNGGSLQWCSGAVVEFSDSFRLLAICRHRFAHGRLFGRSRVAERKESRMRLVLASPLVPVVLAARISTRVRQKRRDTMRFLSAVPLVVTIAACWAAGEAVGAIESPVADRN
jgi:hypothetical protein